MQLEEAFPVPARYVPAVGDRVRDIVEQCYLLYQASDEVQARHRIQRLRPRDDERVGLLRRLLPVIDAVDRLLKAETDPADDPVRANYVRGLTALRKRLDLLLEREGVRPIPTVGQPLNLDWHDVVEVVENETMGETRVVAERERGYFLGDRVLRDAKVVVNRPRQPEMSGPSDY